jgi:hypothetical protein
MGKWLCMNGFVFMNVGIKVMFDQCPKDWKYFSLQPSELTISSCSLEPNQLRELVAQHINPKLQNSSNGHVMMSFCLWMWGLGFYFINVQEIQPIVHINSYRSSFHLLAILNKMNPISYLLLMNSTWTFISCSSIDVIMLTTMLNTRFIRSKNIYHLNLMNSPFPLIVILNPLNPRSWLFNIQT